MEKDRRENIVIVIDNSSQIREIDLNAMRKQRISFGRDASNNIVLDSAIVSKSHGFFEFVGESLYIYDNNSTNGIVVNGRHYTTDNRGETEAHKLREGDVIRIDNKDVDDRHSMGVLILYTTRKSSGSWHKVFLQNLPRVTIGRNPECNIHLDNINVSRQHAVVTKVGDNLYIEDLKSSNGVFINGQRVFEKTPLHEKDIITIGNSKIFFTSGMFLYKSNMGGTEVVMKDVSRIVTVKKQKRAILQNVNLTVEPNEFIAIIGGSGAGKSTVMNAMNGFEKATSGAVFINGSDLYKNYQVLKNMIGYVPQQDIIYENITLQKMLEYSAKMRMLEDVSEAEYARRIDEVLHMVELEEHRDKFIRSLSGGQKKRASIAVELLADPGLFFLDEPTSGLDPGTEASLMQTLNSLAKHKGKTIIMVTHTTQNLHLCDKILFMGKGGKVCFYGSPSECMDFFEVDNLTEIYNKALTDKDVEKWSAKYIKEYGNDKKEHCQDSHRHKNPLDKKASFLNQFAILTSRYMTLIKNDTQRLLMIFLQPIIIAILLTWVASDDVFDVYNSTKSILFALSCAGIWVGLFNSIQEICKERNILKREYMANLRLGAYVLSKFVVQLLLSVIQAVIMIGMFVAMVGGPDSGILMENAFFEMFVTMLMTIFSSSAIGIVVSAVSKNSDKAMTVAPFLLIIQLLFSGILFELKGFTEKIAYFTISKWSVAAFGTISNLNELELSVPGMPHEAEEVYEYVFSNIGKSWSVMALIVLICFVTSVVLLKNISKDSR